MAAGNKAYTVQESTNPYFKGVVGTTSSTPSRAIMNNLTADDVTITFADNTTAVIHMIQGTLYPVSAIASSASILYLY
tara:strand:- start:879 stop:1112 length:234 start_codon:yes stop_codon:yes gene_type:complete